MKKDIDIFLQKNRPNDPDFSKKLADYLTQERRWTTVDDANARALTVLRRVFTSKIDAAGRRSSRTEYDEGFSEGLREAVEIIKDNLE